MNKDEIIQRIKEWTQENYPIGIALGYPQCCIDAFCQVPPQMLSSHLDKEVAKLRFRASHINGKYTGFIPCENHARQILSGAITLESLIHNRNFSFPPFPNA